MIRIKQYHIRASDQISGVLRTSAPIALPLGIYLSKVNMTVFLRRLRPCGVPGGYMFNGVVHHGRHESATVESDASGYVATEVIPYIDLKEDADVKA